MKIFCFSILLVLSVQSFGQDKLVSVNGSNYNVCCKGFENRKKVTPVVVFENGMGSDLGSWKRVVDKIA